MSYFVNWTCSEMGYYTFICTRSKLTFAPSFSNLDDWDFHEGRTKTTSEENFPTIVKLESNGTTVKYTSIFVMSGQNDGAGRMKWPEIHYDGNVTFRSYWIKKGTSKLHMNRIGCRVNIDRIY